MENENKFKLKFPKIFTSSCKTQKLSEVIDHKNPIFTPQNSLFLQTPLMENNDPFPSSVMKPNKQTQSVMCKPRCPKTFDQMVRENCIFTTTRRKITGKYTLLSPSVAGRRCPPASPVSPLNQRYKKQRNRKMKNPRKKNGGKNNENFEKFINLSSPNETDLGDWFSSDDEREDEEKTETLFSLSSESDHRDSAVTRCRNRRREEFPAAVKDTFAMVKRSSDPYNDFRKSMVEMIMEKQIFGAKELEQLLQCFLSLNSPHHHRVIVEVFIEIWDALFSHWS